MTIPARKHVPGNKVVLYIGIKSKKLNSQNLWYNFDRYKSYLILQERPSGKPQLVGLCKLFAFGVPNGIEH